MGQIRSAALHRTCYTTFRKPFTQELYVVKLHFRNFRRLGSTASEEAPWPRAVPEDFRRKSHLLESLEMLHLTVSLITLVCLGVIFLFGDSSPSVAVIVAFIAMVFMLFASFALALDKPFCRYIFILSYALLIPVLLVVDLPWVVSLIVSIFGISFCASLFLVVKFREYFRWASSLG